MEIDWAALDWLILALPVALGVIAVRIGSAQVREFHRRTGDTGVIMSIAGLSRFAEKDPVVEEPEQAAEPAKDLHHAEAA